jgi:hypothetical protein
MAKQKEIGRLVCCIGATCKKEASTPAFASKSVWDVMKQMQWEWTESCSQ